MATSHLETRSAWDEVVLPAFNPLSENLTADVVVVGAGITGLTTAILLMQSGLRVAVVERYRVGGVDTRRTTAHLTAVPDERLHALAQRDGDTHTRLVWQAGESSIARIEELIVASGADCGFERVPGYLHCPVNASPEVMADERARLEDDARVAGSCGASAMMVDAAPLVGVAAMRVDHQALFHPLAYVRALVEYLRAAGCALFERSEATFGSSKGEVHCGEYTIRAGATVIATHNPLAGRQGTVSASIQQTTLALYTSYAMQGRVDRHLDAGCFWDTSDPYRYVRVQHDAGGSVVIAGGEDHKTGQCEDTQVPFDTLERWFRELSPDVSITHRWSGQVIESLDGLPLIGEVEEGQYIATGYAGNGMTFGTLAAMVIHDAIVGRKNAFADVMHVNRRMVPRSPLEYVRENMDYPKRMVLDRLPSASRTTVEGLPRGVGAVVTLDGRPVAAARHDDGSVTLRSAVCPHMGCHVRWNNAERTWDCPCHGSRFTPLGDVLAGPAEAPLAEVPAEPSRSGSTD